MKALIVDDEPLSRDALVDLALAATGRAPIEAPDGRAAWARLDAGEAVGLVLTDIRMPHVNGLELVGKMRADPRFEHVPVMLITTAGDRATVENALGAGVQGFVLKPVTQGAVQRVRQVLQQFEASLLDPNHEAMARLGVDQSRFDTYLRALVAQAHELADRLTVVVKGTEQPLRRELLLAVQQQRAVAATLGARRLVGVLGWIERCLQGVGPVEGDELASALASYRLNLYWLHNASKACRAGTTGSAQQPP